MGIRKIGKNEWTLDVRVWVNRKEIRKRERFSGSKREAELECAVLKKRLAKQGSRNFSESCKVFADVLELYRQKRGEIPRQQRALYNRLKRDLGGAPLIDFPNRFESYLAKVRNSQSRRTGKPLSNATVNRLVAMTRAAFNVALYMEKIGKNPITPRRFPKLKEVPRDRVLSQDEKLRLFNVIAREAPYLEPIVRFALQVPCRKSELVNMKREDLNLLAVGIRVHNGTTKTGMGLWKPIPPDMRTYFENLPSECPYLFYRYERGEYKPLGDFKRAWGRVKRLAGIRDFRFHDTRHNAATDRVNSGTPDQVVNEIAGWSPKSNMLSRYYNYGGQSNLKLIKFSSETGHSDRTVESRSVVSG